MKRKTHTVRFFVWLIACFPLLTWASSPIYYVHSDHLGTPQKLSDDTGTVVWEAEYEPFGEATVNDDPDLDGNAVEFNLRFPGQYYDKYTGANYNYYRDYDPSTGRYLQSDPIGLRGGFNTYGYAHQNPLFYIDPYGLYCLSDAEFAAIAGGVAGGISGALDGAIKGSRGGLAGATLGAIGGSAIGAAAGVVGGSVVGNLGSGGADSAAAGAILGSANSGISGVAGAAIGSLITSGIDGVTGNQLGSGAPSGAIGGFWGGLISNGVLGGLTSSAGAAISGALVDALRAGNDCDEDCATQRR